MTGLPECAICIDVYKAPILILSCSHDFCKSCLERSFATKKECPICRKTENQNINQLTRNRSFEQTIELLQNSLQNNSSNSADNSSQMLKKIDEVFTEVQSFVAFHERVSHDINEAKIQCASLVDAQQKFLRRKRSLGEMLNGNAQQTARSEINKNYKKIMEIKTNVMQLSGLSQTIEVSGTCQREWIRDNVLGVYRFDGFKDGIPKYRSLNKETEAVLWYHQEIKEWYFSKPDECNETETAGWLYSWSETEVKNPLLIGDNYPGSPSKWNECTEDDEWSETPAMLRITAVALPESD